jgi:hypothetical protein
MSVVEIYGHTTLQLTAMALHAQSNTVFCNYKVN